MVDGDLQGMPDQGGVLLDATLVQADHRFRVECLGDHLWQGQRLGDVECGLQAAQGDVHVSLEKMEFAQGCRQSRQIFVGLVLRQHRERLLHPVDALGQAALFEVDVAQPGREAGSSPPIPARLERLRRRVVVGFRSAQVADQVCSLTCSFEEPRPGERILFETCGLLEVPLRFTVGAQ